jgi:hypothetical protein
MLMRHQEDSDADSDDEDEVDTEALLRQAQQMLADKKAEKAAQRDRAKARDRHSTRHVFGLEIRTHVLLTGSLVALTGEEGSGDKDGGTAVAHRGHGRG